MQGPRTDSQTQSVSQLSDLKPASILFFNKRTVMQRKPLGVVGIISPWNYPLSIPFGEVVMGLMAGNAILLKVAAATPLVGEAIDRIVEAGGFISAPTGGAPDANLIPIPKPVADAYLPSSPAMQSPWRPASRNPPPATS